MKNGNSSNSSSNNIQREEFDESFAKKFSLPLKTVKELEDFNKAIQNQELYKKYIISQYSKIGGNEGNKKADKIAPMLAGIFLANEMLTHISWTGISRTPGLERKISFQLFESVIDLFFDLLNSADSRWTRADNISFF